MSLQRRQAGQKGGRLIQEAGEGQLRNGGKILGKAKRLVYPMNWAEPGKGAEKKC